MRFNSEECLDMVRMIKPDAHTVGAVNGTGVDCRGYRMLAVFIDVGTFGTSVDLKLQESSDNGVGDAWADISGAAITQIVASDKQAIIRVALQQRERYIRAVMTAGGTEDVAVFGILHNADVLPVTQSHSDETVLV